eukprot:1993348-Rhodomonas_salina.2
MRPSAPGGPGSGSAGDALRHGHGGSGARRCTLSPPREESPSVLGIPGRPPRQSLPSHTTPRTPAGSSSQRRPAACCAYAHPVAAWPGWLVRR